MGDLLSCPFCRELFSQDEGPNCPECELPLVPLNKLPLSLDAQADLALLPRDPPEDQTLPFAYFGRARGPSILTALIGVGLFFAPWVSLERPDEITLTGHDLAMAGAPWLFGGVVGWFILVPLVLSRRSVNQLRGIRVIASFFAALTLGETALLLLRPPEAHGYFGPGLQYTWGLFASAACAALGLFLSARLGGSLEDLRDLPLEIPVSGPSSGEPLH